MSLGQGDRVSGRVPRILGQCFGQEKLGQYFGQGRFGQCFGISYIEGFNYILNGIFEEKKLK